MHSRTVTVIIFLEPLFLDSALMLFQNQTKGCIFDSADGIINGGDYCAYN